MTPQLQFPAHPQTATHALHVLFGKKGAKKLAGFQDVAEMFDGNIEDAELAAQVAAVKTLAHAMTAAILKKQDTLSSWSAVVAYFRARLARLKHEEFHVLYLDRKNKLIEDVVAKGTVDHCPVYVREVAKKALEVGASAVILAHNHPSGDPTPSQSDIQMTHEVQMALKLFDIAVHDHIIIGAEREASLKQLGLLS